MEKLDFEQFKADVHRSLISKLDLERLATVQGNRAKQAVANLVQEIIAEKKQPLSAIENERVQSDLLTEYEVLGPSEPLLRDPKKYVIRVKVMNLVYVERGGLLQKT